jgi:hypothetical protein
VGNEMPALWKRDKHWRVAWQREVQSKDQGRTIEREAWRLAEGKETQQSQA